MREFARAVEAVAEGRPMPEADAVPVMDALPLPRAVPVAAHAAAPAVRANGGGEPKYASGPIPRAFREKLTDLLGAAALAPAIAALCTAPWALFQSPVEWTLLGRVFLLSTALGWGALLIAMLAPPVRRDTNTWGRRLHMLLAGLAVGALAFWLDGWVVPRGGTAAETSRDIVVGTWARVSPDTFSVAMKYLFYFGVTAAVCRWWTLTDRRRKERFRFLPIISAGFWGAAFLFLWPWESASAALGIAPLVIATVAVQVASPWNPPPPAVKPARADAGRRVRHRVAV
jgi:hypothetical protein